MDGVVGGMIVKWTVMTLMITVLCIVSFELGKSKARVEIIEREVEVIKYVEKKRAKILSAPNASRDDLLERMRSGIL